MTSGRPRSSACPQRVPGDLIQNSQLFGAFGAFGAFLYISLPCFFPIFSILEPWSPLPKRPTYRSSRQNVHLAQKKGTTCWDGFCHGEVGSLGDSSNAGLMRKLLEDAREGIPFLDWTEGKRLKTLDVHSFTLP